VGWSRSYSEILTQNRKTSTLTSQGLRSGFFKYLCSKYGSFLLSDAETKELDKADKAERQEKEIEKVSPLLLPVWSFFVALCHALQHGENDLTARRRVVRSC
jgi:phosphate/sulfate permease